MKNIIFSIATMSLLTMLSCSDNTSSPVTPSVLNQRITMKVNGTTYTTTTAQDGATKCIAKIYNSNNVLAIQSDKDNISLNIGFIAVQTDTVYRVSNTSALNASFLTVGTTQYSNLANSKGYMQFSVKNKRATGLTNTFQVEGVFSGVLYNVTKTDSVVITDGIIQNL